MVRAKIAGKAHVENLQLRAREAEQTLGKKLINKAMKQWPNSISEMVSKLEAIGVVEADSQSGDKFVVQPQFELKRSVQAQAQANRKRKGRYAQAPDTDHTELPEDPKDTIPNKYWTLGGLSAKLISTQLLIFADKVVLTKVNLTSIFIRGAAEKSHQYHVEVLVFISGMDPGFKLVGKYRSWTHLRALFLQNVRSLGHRARSLPLPPHWPDDGIWAIVEADGKDHVHMKHKFHEWCSFDLALSMCPPYGKDWKKNLYVKDNFSDANASVASQLHPEHTHDLRLMAHQAHRDDDDHVDDEVDAIHDCADHIDYVDVDDDAGDADEAAWRAEKQKHD